jgi:hypothetical protein
MAMTASAVLRHAAAAAPVGLVVYVVAWIFQLVVAAGLVYRPGAPKALVAVFSLFPWSLFSKAVGDLTSAGTGQRVYEQLCYCWRAGGDYWAGCWRSVELDAALWKIG